MRRPADRGRACDGGGPLGKVAIGLCVAASLPRALRALSSRPAPGGPSCCTRTSSPASGSRAQHAAATSTRPTSTTWWASTRTPTREQAEDAIAAAHAPPSRAGARSTPQQRADVLDRIGTEILARKEELGRLLVARGRQDAARGHRRGRAGPGRSSSSSPARRCGSAGEHRRLRCAPASTSRSPASPWAWSG